MPGNTLRLTDLAMKSSEIKLAFLCLVFILPVVSAAVGECWVGSDSKTAVNLYISSKRNETGEWITSFSIDKADPTNETSNNVTLKLTQDVSECMGKKMVHVRGIISGEPLHFYPRNFAGNIGRCNV
jgi:hypothetical protein